MISTLSHLIVVKNELQKVIQYRKTYKWKNLGTQHSKFSKDLKVIFALLLYNKLLRQDITGRNDFSLDFVQGNSFSRFLMSTLIQKHQTKP